MIKKISKVGVVTMARTIRSIDERVATIDEKIAKKQSELAKLEQQKKDLLTPKPKKKAITMKAVFSKAKEEGLEPEEIAKKLGIKIEE